MVSHVEGCNADRVTGGNQPRGSLGLVEKDEGEHAVEHVAKVGTVLLVQVHDNLAVGVSLELVVTLQSFTKSKVVVDFAVDGENDLLIFGNEGLGASVYI